MTSTDGLRTSAHTKLILSLPFIAAITLLIVAASWVRVAAADTTEITLQPGWNLITWPWPDNTVDNALHSLADTNQATAVWGYSSDGSWQGYFPAAANVPGINNLSTLSLGTAYFVALAQGPQAVWTMPPSSLPKPPSTPPALTSGWHSIAPLPEAAFNLQAVTLPSGDVLAMGGETCTDTPGTYTYATQLNTINGTDLTWDSSRGNLPLGFVGSTVVVLNNGNVLAVGGSAAGALNGSPYVVEYDPVARQLPLDAPMLTTGRQQPVVIQLKDGRVLVAGGVTNPGGDDITAATALDSAEIFDPVSTTWTPAAPMLHPRSGASAALLSDGKVLVVGGVGLNPWPKVEAWDSGEVYDPATNTWTPTGPIGPAGDPSVSGFFYMGLARLHNGRVLAIGGTTRTGAVASVFSFDESTNAWTEMAPLTAPRYFPLVAVLPDGRVLAAGGYGATIVNGAAAWLTSSEIYDPATNTWAFAGDVGSTASNRAIAQLPNGNVLLIGGASFNGTSTSCTNEVDMFVP